MSQTNSFTPALSPVVIPTGSIRVRDMNILLEQPSSGRLRVWQPSAVPTVSTPLPSTSSRHAGPSPKRSRRSRNQVLYKKQKADQSTNIIKKVWQPSDVPTVSTPLPSTSSGHAGPSPKRSRRSRNQVLFEKQKADKSTCSDSGSEEDDADSDGNIRQVARRLRNYNVFREERLALADFEREDVLAAEEEWLEDELFAPENVDEGEVSPTAALSLSDVAADAEDGEAVAGDVGEVDGVAAGAENLNAFSWSEDFSTFTSQEEVYLKSPGPQVPFTEDPVNLFNYIWDAEIMSRIVSETNKYAWQTICELSETDRLAKSLDEWKETTVDEIYRLFAMFIYMSICNRARLDEYWTTGVLEMPEFRRIMSRNRFNLLLRFLHFVDNDELVTRSYDRKIGKIAPIVKHCNSKFCSMYTPQKELSLDESLLLWKGRLSWVQSIRTKAARFGIKTFELCEADSGYILRSLLYAGKNSSMVDQTFHGFENSTVAKVVLELMDGYLDVGHLLVMDNWYNQLPLSRYLKQRRTDVIGTLNRRRLYVPPAIKTLNYSVMKRGDQVAKHCGDLTIIAWKDFKLVTAVSTYHNAEQVVCQRSGVQINKPVLISTYNKFMGGVDRKDQKLSMYLMERKRGMKWYMKVFRRLLNESLMNTFILYTKNPLFKVYTHRQFRYKVAEGLLRQFPQEEVDRPLARSSKIVRLDGLGDHYPVFTDDVVTTDKHKHSRRRCVRCTANGLKKQITTMCSKCKVPLCLAKCWIEYHTLKKL